MKKMHFRISGLTLALAAGLLLTACTPAPAPDDSVLHAGSALPTAAPVVTTVPMVTPVPSEALFDERYFPHVSMTGGVTKEQARAVLQYLEDGGDELIQWLEAESRTMFFHRAEAFEGGTLVLATVPYDGENYANLYYLENGAVRYASAGADCWSINIARLLGKTVVFGTNFAYDRATDEVHAAFSDGQTASQPFVTDGLYHEGVAAEPGFFLVADGYPELTRLEMRKDGAAVADATSPLFEVGASQRAWDGTAFFMRDVVYSCDMFDALPTLDWSEYVALNGKSLGLYDMEFCRFAKNQPSLQLSDLWRANNARYALAEVPSGSILPLLRLPEDVSGVYLADFLLDDGSADAETRVMQPLSLVGDAVALPSLPVGALRLLIVDTADAYWALRISIR